MLHNGTSSGGYQRDWLEWINKQPALPLSLKDEEALASFLRLLQSPDSGLKPYDIPSQCRQVYQLNPSTLKKYFNVNDRMYLVDIESPDIVEVHLLTCGLRFSLELSDKRAHSNPWTEKTSEREVHDVLAKLLTPDVIQSEYNNPRLKEELYLSLSVVGYKLILLDILEGLVVFEVNDGDVYQLEYPVSMGGSMKVTRVEYKVHSAIQYYIPQGRDPVALDKDSARKVFKAFTINEFYSFT